MDCLSIDPRSPDWVVKAHAQSCAGTARVLVSSVDRTMRAPCAKTLVPWRRAAKKTIVATELEWSLNGLAVEQGLSPIGEEIGQGGRVARMVDGKWWLRRLRKSLRQQNEVQEHAAGHIRRKKQCYVSDHACRDVRIRTKANAETLERLEVVNELGEAFNLGEVAEASVSNPALRRAELMTRCRGFEETANFMGHVAVFLTLTTPSRFHRMRHEGGPNPKWEGATPKDGQKYLCALWGKIRAAWGNRGFHPYGFRVCEPHHDGTPHWHLLLFMPAEQVGWFVPERLIAGRKDFGAGLVGIMGKYALKDSPAERGAAKHRFTVKAIDPKRIGKDGKPCTATGYIAKYIAKNIDGTKEDGDGVGLDYASGQEAAKAAQRVRVWASTWGIRQFQQLGGPSVTAWREVRKLGAVETAQADLFDNAQAAADRGDWMAFYMVQGGPEVKRTELALKPYYVQEEGGKYGDTIKRVQGVECVPDQRQVQTRLHTWTVQVAGLAEVNAQQAEFQDYMNREKAVAKFLAEAGISGREEFHARAAGAWTGVNNCTPQPVFDWSVFEPAETDMPYSPECSRTGTSDAQMEEVWNAMREAQAINLGKWGSSRAMT